MQNKPKFHPCGHPERSEGSLSAKQSQMNTATIKNRTNPNPSVGEASVLHYYSPLPERTSLLLLFTICAKQTQIVPFSFQNQGLTKNKPKFHPCRHPERSKGSLSAKQSQMNTATMKNKTKPIIFLGSWVLASLGPSYRFTKQSQT